MKIYINNLNLDLLNEYTKFLKKYNNKITQFKEIYTTNSIYHIKEDKIYCLKPYDSPIEICYNYYEKMTIISDNSFYNISETTNILGETHICNEIVQYNYELRPDDDLELVIQFCKNHEKNKLIPFDLYFESNKQNIIKIDDVNIRNQIYEFIDIILEI
jgi:hypothetical protein